MPGDTARRVDDFHPADRVANEYLCHRLVVQRFIGMCVMNKKRAEEEWYLGTSLNTVFSKESRYYPIINHEGIFNANTTPKMRAELLMDDICREAALRS